MRTQIAFRHNLRLYREKAHLTQRQLAEKIGYSEKSVSKWENGSGFPTVEVLAELASVFQISLDSLVFEKPSRHYLLGIDGGGTATVFKLTDEDGAVQSILSKGSSNPNDIGMDKALQVLEEGIKEVCSGIAYSQITMFAGISGGGMSGDNIRRLRDFFQTFGFYHFANGSDVENAVALIPRNPCILMIMGTGVISYRIEGTNRKRIAGWGQLFDDGGSGYSIGRDGITAALQALDGSGEETVISSLLFDRLGESPESHLARFYRGGKQYIAGFSDIVFEAAEMNDPIAQKILEKNMLFVSRIIQTAAAGFEKPVPVYFSGGISRKNEILFPLIRKSLGDGHSLIPLKEEPIEGALKNAGQLLSEKKSEDGSNGRGSCHTIE